MPRGDKFDFAVQQGVHGIAAVSPVYAFLRELLADLLANLFAGELLVCAKLRRQLNGSDIMGIKPQADTCLSVSAGFAEPMASEVPEQTLSLALTRKEIFFQFSIC